VKANKCARQVSYWINYEQLTEHCFWKQFVWYETFRVKLGRETTSEVCAATSFIYRPRCGAANDLCVCVGGREVLWRVLKPLLTEARRVIYWHIYFANVVWIIVYHEYRLAFCRGTPCHRSARNVEKFQVGTYVCVCVYVCTNVCMYISMYLRTYVCMCVCTFLYILTYVHMIGFVGSGCCIQAVFFCRFPS
jgi:hypothetical protein